MRLFILHLLALLPIIVIGQEVNDFAQDTIPHRHYSWHTMAFRTGFGFNKAFYYEIGPSYVFHEADAIEGFGNAAIYTTFEWTPAPNTYGVKFGGEFGSNLSMVALEFKYQSDNVEDDFVITPKIGLGLGFVNMYYGFNISTNKYPFDKIGKNQFTMVFNINRKYYQLVRG